MRITRTIYKSSDTSRTYMEGRQYPDGEPIPYTLPDKYRISERCGTCAAYLPDRIYCTAWGTPVRPEYVCPGWAPIQMV